MPTAVSWDDTTEGWRWLFLPEGTPALAGWADLGFDDSAWCPAGGQGWKVGRIPIGSDDCGGYGQPFGSGGWTVSEAPTIRTVWNETDDLYARHEFELPAGVTSLSLSLRCDNHLDAYVDGSFIAATDYSGGGHPTTANQTNGGPHVVTAPALISEGTHVLAYLATNIDGPTLALVKVDYS